MTITITMDLTEENLKKLQAFIPEAKPVADVKPKAKPEAQKQAPKAQNEPVQLSIFDETNEPQNANTEPEEDKPPFDVEAKPVAVTKTDVRAVALAVAKAGKQKELAATFAKFGGQKLSDFDARPDVYPALMSELKKINV